MKAFLEAVLDEVEVRESGLLVWGAVDGSLSAPELEEIIDPKLDMALDQGEELGFFDATGAIAEMVRRGWVVVVPKADGSSGYRSRMAETVRLLARLRQLFPKHIRTAEGWQLAPTLTADFRFQRRQRRYPRRDVSIQEAMTQLRAVTNDPSLLACADVILSSSGPIREGGVAGFQVRAASRIIGAIEARKAWATMVCAGTGSGKTLAFYLPAIASILRHRLADPTGAPWVKVVAIYPRNELLKDQLRELLSRLRGLPGQIGQKALPRIRVGAFYGDVPSRAGADMWWPKAWRSAGGDKICPFLRCLTCDGDLLWREDDFTHGREHLFCRTNGCGFSIKQDEIALTRQSQALQPPDIIFCSSEMLNRQMSDTRYCHLFGIGPQAVRPPETVLIDEVHTYDGRHGAQVAYLFRRWQHLIGHRLRFVGLSATLREGSRFFADVIGTWATSVAEISPTMMEMDSEGAEYMVALRGDPVSRASLLSTTIQAAMLMQRCLDCRPSGGRPVQSRGLYGTKTFAFTDNLDVINRLYFNLLDAEGRDGFGAPDLVNAPRGGLAVLREPGLSRARYLAGQDWRSCVDLGHTLSDRLVVRRVSSQDKGFDGTADIVVATASLEVGFDDPSVGAVIQHKAPRSLAGFLQRRGRAGRQRGMRPWTLVVLSDYGRDRIAYQGYDVLFDPELPVRTLPLRSRYICRMQATYALLDYLSMRMPPSSTGSVWQNLSSFQYLSDARRTELSRLIRGLLESEASAAEFAEYLSRALHLDADEVSALMWEYPRPIMTAVLPTALRRLETKWRDEQPMRDKPLPEFISSSLFSDLALPEVRIELQRTAHAADDGDENFMPLFAAIKEFAPGRVSRRFGIRHEDDCDWIAPPEDILGGASMGNLEIDALGDTVPVGIYEVVDRGHKVQLPVFRPLRINPTRPPKFIGDTSNSSVRWQTQFVPHGAGLWLDRPSKAAERPVFNRAGFFLHSHHMPVEVRRFAASCEAELRIGTASHRAEISFTRGGVAAALGAAFAADGVAFDFAMPGDLCAVVRSNDRLSRVIRTLRFTSSAWRGDSLKMVPSPFQREWLAQIQLSAITYEAVRANVSLQEAAESVGACRSTISRKEVLAVLFRSQVVVDEGRDVRLTGEDRLVQDLLQLLDDKDVAAELDRASQQSLWGPITEEWESWLREVYHSTLAAALMRAISDLCPGVDVESLVADLESDTGEGEPKAQRVWISERGPGGNGELEQFMREYAEDPRRFCSMVRAALEMGEFELIDHQLSRLLVALTTDSQQHRVTIGAVAQLRSATDNKDLTAAVQRLRVGLGREGFHPFHGFIVSAMNRILRPNSGPRSDRFLASTIERWNAQEQRLGIEIDQRIVTYWLSQYAEIDEIAEAPGLGLGDDCTAWRMGAISGLLWSRGRSTREGPLRMYHPFNQLPPVERLLVLHTIIEDDIRISVDDRDWLTKAAEYLGNGHLVTLTCDGDMRERLAQALGELICNPIETGYVRAYARMQGVRISMGAVEANIELIEALS